MIIIQTYQRRNTPFSRKLWGWRAVHSNGNIIATDGGQGYENRADMIGTIETLRTGFSSAKIV